MRELRSRRLLMRPLSPGDRDLYIRLYTDPEVMRHIGPPLSPASASEAFALAAELGRRPFPHYWVWTVVAREEQRPIGLVGLRTTHDEGSTEIGILLAPEAYGLGYATETIARVTLHALVDLGFASVEASHHEENRAVAALLLKIGFTRRIQSVSSPDWRWMCGRREHAQGRMDNRWAQWIGP